MKSVDRTTLNIDRDALARAAALTGVKEKTALEAMYRLISVAYSRLA